MARLPIPGSDQGTWGEVLNDYLKQSLNPDGTLKDNSITSSQLAPSSITSSSLQSGSITTSKIQDGTISEAKLDTAVQTKLNAGGGGATNLVASVSSTSVTVTSDTGTDAVISSATTTDAGAMSATDKTKLNGIAAGATVNATDAELRDRSTHTGVQAISTVTGLQTALDAKASTGSLAPVATSGSYADISGAPTIPATLADLSDVDTAGAISGQVLKFDGSIWGPDADAGGGTAGDPAVGGDLAGTASNAQIVAGAVTNTEIAAGAAIAKSKLAALNIADADVAAGAAIAQSKIANLTTDLAGKAASTHAHAVADVTNLQTNLDAKADESITVTGANSLTGGGNLTANRTLALVNDATTPGNSRYYGTDGAGAKGYHVLPSGSGDPTMGGDLSGTASNAQIAAGAVTNTEIAAGAAIAKSKLAALNIADADVAAGAAIAKSKLAALNIADADVAAGAAIAQSKIANLTTDLAGKASTSHTHSLDNLTDVNLIGAVSGEVLKYDGTNWVAAADASGGAGDPTMGGDLSGTASNAQIAAGAVTNTEIAAGAAIAKSKLAALNIADADVAAGAAIAQSKIANLTTDLAGKADELITITGANSLTGGGSLAANRTLALVNDATSPGNSRYYGTDGAGAKGYHVLPSGGDPTMGGDLSGTASNAQIAANAVGTTEIANSAVTDAKVATGIAQSKITNLTTDLAGKASTTHVHSATDISSGTMASARLGTGTANNTTYLRGDGIWATPAGGGTEFSPILDVDGQFGGGWAGVIAACAAAQALNSPSAVVMMGKGPYDATSTINITRPFTLQGGGIRGTRLRHSGAFTGPLFRCENLKRSGEWESTVGSGPIQSYDEAVDDGGMTFRDFSIVDDDRSVANRHGIYCIDVDDMLMDNIQFGFLTGTALKLGADDADALISGVSSGRIRESDFRRIRIYRCGSGSPSGSPDVPALILQNGNDSGDGTNQNFFHQLRFVYNEGRMVIRGAGNGGNSLRRTIFRDSQLHALADNSNWTPVQYFPFDMVTIEGAVRETFFDGLTINGNKAGTYCFRLKGHALNAETPKRLVIRNANLVNIHGGFVKVEKGDSVMIDGTGLGATDEFLLSVDAASGFQKYHIHEFGINQPSAGDMDVNAGSGTVYSHGTNLNL